MNDRVGRGLAALAGEDQRLLLETTARFLDDTAPVAATRAGGPRSPGWWEQAAALGWTSLLVAEADGGGSVSGDAMVDAALVAEELGRVAAGGPFVACNVVARCLSQAGPLASRDDALAQILSGAATATWLAPEFDERTGLASPTFAITSEEDGVLVVDGDAVVEADADTAWLLLTMADGEAMTQALVASGSTGVEVEARRSVDLSRSAARVRLRGVRVPATSLVGPRGEAAAAVAAQLDTAVVLQCAELVGLCRQVLHMTVEYALDRYSFGRPIASYQALKHRLADMRLALEAGFAVVDAAARAVGSAAPDAAEQASVAKVWVAERALALVQDCVQMHGGIGLTWEHDIHVYLRRAMLHHATFGTPAFHRQRIATGLGLPVGR